MADRYWRGGSGTWDTTNTANWSTTSGGPGGASVPTSIDDVYFDPNSGAGTVTMGTGGITCRNLDFTTYIGTITGTGTLSLYGNLTLSASMTNTWAANYGVINILGTCSITARATPLNSLNISADVTFIDSPTIQQNIVWNSGNINVNNNLVKCGWFQQGSVPTGNIAWGINGLIQLTSTTPGQTVLDLPNATNITFSGTGGRFISSNNIAKTLNFGSNDPPGTAHPAPIRLQGTSASSCHIVPNSKVGPLQGTSFSGTLTGLAEIYGDVDIGQANNLTGFQLEFRGAGTLICPIFPNPNKYLASLTVFTAAVCTVSTRDALITSLALVGNTTSVFNANGFNVFTQTVSCAGCTLDMGSGTWYVGGSFFTISSPSAVIGGNATIRMTSASQKTFTGAGKTFSTLQNDGAGELIIAGSNTFNTITNSVQPTTFSFTSGTTQTVTNFTVNGTSGNFVTIKSTIPGSQATLSKSSGTVTATFCAIKDSNATGGATWNAPNSVANLGNNTGWIFANSGQGMFAIF